jgi:Ca2+-binding EF-hand superfamily protein
VSAKDILTDEKLISAFNILDMDGNGRITKEDLALVFKNSQGIDNEVLEEMVAEADELGNGEIGYNEFKNLMLSIQD